jgi:hypothetical protein
VRLRELVAILSPRQDRGRIYQKLFDKAHFPAGESITMRTPLVAAAAVCGTTLLSATAASSTISTVYRALPWNAGPCRLLYRKVSNDYVFAAL